MPLFTRCKMCGMGTTTRAYHRLKPKELYAQVYNDETKQADQVLVGTEPPDSCLRNPATDAAPPPEHLHVTCAHCGHDWTEPPYFQTAEGKAALSADAQTADRNP